MSKLTFNVTENVRRVTSHEVDTDDLTPEQLELVALLVEDEVLDEDLGDDLVDSLVAAGVEGDFDEYPADEPDYVLSYVGRGS